MDKEGKKIDIKYKSNNQTRDWLLTFVSLWVCGFEILCSVYRTATNWRKLRKCSAKDKANKKRGQAFNT